MKITTLAGNRTPNLEQRSTAYYYGDLERLKRKTDETTELSEYVVPNVTPPEETHRPVRQWSLPEYRIPETSSKLSENSTPKFTRHFSYKENTYSDGNQKGASNIPESSRNYKDFEQTHLQHSRKPHSNSIVNPQYALVYRNEDRIEAFINSSKEQSRDIPEAKEVVRGETYSTAGTFPLPEQKEKEPLLAELEIVGRVPLSELESTGVRRTRSWYLCCPNVGEDDLSRESSWRYSSLRPVTAPPAPNRIQAFDFGIASQSTHDDAAALKAERDALAKSLAAERARSAALSRAHDARLAELHGVIAELMRRRAEDKKSGAIPEETSDGEECESTTQPAEELENDAEISQTEQNDTSSQLSPSFGPQCHQTDGPDSTECDPKIIVEHSIQTDTETENNAEDLAYNYETSLNLSEKGSGQCLNEGCRLSPGQSAASCERERGSLEDTMRLPGHGRPESRQAKLASRVRLRKTTEHGAQDELTTDEMWCAERLALNVCAQADLREAIVASEDEPSVLRARLSLAVCTVARLEADAALHETALNRAADTAYRLWFACTSLESSAVKLCSALSSADRALEAYDVLLALAESRGECEQRAAAEQIANQLLRKLEEEETPKLGAPMMTTGPWMNHQYDAPPSPWAPPKEWSLRRHAARLKALTASARGAAPRLFSLHDMDDIDMPEPVKPVSNAEMENAVMLQEIALAREQRAAALSALVQERATNRLIRGTASTGRRYTKPKHWLEQSAETDL